MEVLFLGALPTPNPANKNKMKTIMSCPLASDEMRRGSHASPCPFQPLVGMHLARASLNLMIQSSEIFIMTVRFP